MDRHKFMGRAALVAVLALLAATACGGRGVPVGAVESPSALPSLPQGRPVPAELAGAWELVGDPTKNVKLTGMDYLFGDGSTGKVAVNGSEIDFYSGQPCNIPLPGGVGRYRWSISAGLLILSAITPVDPCPRLSVLANPQGWQRPP